MRIVILFFLFLSAGCSSVFKKSYEHYDVEFVDEKSPNVLGSVTFEIDGELQGYFKKAVYRATYFDYQGNIYSAYGSFFPGENKKTAYLPIVPNAGLTFINLKVIADDPKYSDRRYRDVELYIQHEICSAGYKQNSHVDSLRRYKNGERVPGVGEYNREVFATPNIKSIDCYTNNTTVTYHGGA